MTHAEAMALFDRRRRAWLREDLDGYLALWAEDMTFQSPVHDRPLEGKRTFAELVRQSFTLMKPVSFEVRHLAVYGSGVLAEWRIATTHRESGKRIEWEGMSAAEIEGGLIRTWREYWDPGKLKAVG